MLTYVQRIDRVCHSAIFRKGTNANDPEADIAELQELAFLGVKDCFVRHVPLFRAAGK